MFKRATASLALALLLAHAPAAYAGAKGATATPYAAVVSRILADRALQRFKAVCPADLAESLTTRLVKIALPGEADCRSDPEACLKACGEHNGKACFRLAQTLEDAKPAVTYEAIKPLFAVACALGQAIGCTNRASALRNLKDDDPLDHAPESAESCEFRSFNYACARNDAWGCAMTGQAALRGEGVTRNVPMARAMLVKSCRLEPSADSCEFATKLLKEAR